MISKIEIPKMTPWGCLDPKRDKVFIGREDCLKLVAAIEANNKEIEQMTKVYGCADTISMTIWNTDQGKSDTHYAYATKPQPIKKKTKEERAMEFVKEIATVGLFDSNPTYLIKRAREILEESEET